MRILTQILIFNIYYVKQLFFSSIFDKFH